MINNQIPCVLSIAGTDPSGGAGIQADIKAISATGSYAASVITALLAQNTQGVQSIFEINPNFITAQLESVFLDLNIQAVKIGMLHNNDVINTVVQSIHRFCPPNIVFDPVMVAKDGSVLLDFSSMENLKSQLIPNVKLITPNLFEAKHLYEKEITTKQEMLIASTELGEKFNVNVLIKGGHLNDEDSPDVLYNVALKTHTWFDGIRINTKNTHGTGCSLSSAIASYLAQGNTLEQSILMAKKYMSNAILSGSKLSIGLGNGPVDHFYFLENRKYAI